MIEYLLCGLLGGIILLTMVLTIRNYKKIQKDITKLPNDKLINKKVNDVDMSYRPSLDLENDFHMVNDYPYPITIDKDNSISTNNDPIDISTSTKVIKKKKVVNKKKEVKKVINTKSSKKIKKISKISKKK